MLYESICRQAAQLSSRSLAHPMSRREWLSTLPQRRRQWLEMLGLWPLPERTPLELKSAGLLDRKDYIVERLHFQSLPGVHVPGNLYRPKVISRPLPAILYLCGHSSEGKAHDQYQGHGIWFARHGYVALVLDTIEVGEGSGNHHGTMSLGRWDWPSRGYTPAGIEVWNGMRALDYLETRADVDARRFGVTGLSGGGGVSWFLGAADERVKCVAPCCQSGNIAQHVIDRTIDIHCDCAFWINYYQWCWPDIGALIAPRPMIVAAASDDLLWRPYAYRDVVRRLRRQYSELGAPGNIRLVEDKAPHSYTPKLRKAIFAWFNLHLKNDRTPVKDDLSAYIEAEKNLNVFRGKRPEKDLTGKVSELLVRKAEVFEPTNASQWSTHQAKTLAALRALSFRNLRPPAPKFIEKRDKGSNSAFSSFSYVFRSTDGLRLRLKTCVPARTKPTLTIVHAASEENIYFKGRPDFGDDFFTACVQVRNTATTSTGPGYIRTLRRCYPLLGHTLPEKQVADLLDGLSILRRKTHPGKIILYGEGRGAVTAIYAALLDGKVSEIILKDPPGSHARPNTPELPGILRIGDLPQNLALAFPSAITFIGKKPSAYQWTENLYAKLGKRRMVRHIGSMRKWKPYGKQITA